VSTTIRPALELEAKEEKEKKKKKRVRKREKVTNTKIAGLPITRRC
jgi:hypothetical protein